MNTPKPKADYVSNQRRCQDLETKGNRTAPEKAELAALRGQLRVDFMRAFNLSPDHRACRNFANQFKGSSDFDPGHLLDHTDYFRRNGAFVITTQPYGYEPDYLKQWAAHFGAAVTVIDEWGFYRPGQANLILIEFSRRDRNRLSALFAREKVLPVEADTL